MKKKSFKRRAFTIIELLAVLIVIGVLLTIAIPSMTNTLDELKIDAFKINTLGIISEIDNKRMKNKNFNPTNINTVQSLQDILNIKPDNYSGIEVAIVGNKTSLKIIGAGQWDGLVACGTSNDLTVGKTFDTCNNVDIAHDVAGPKVTFGTNGSQIFSKNASSVVIVTDNVQVNQSSLKYLWTTSPTTPSESSFTSSFSNNDNISSPTGLTGNYYLWILAKDVANNMTIISSKAFILDNTSPVITIIGSNPINVNVGTIYTDAGATVYDVMEGDLTSRVRAVGNVDTSVYANYSITYSVTDTAGNSASATRIVNIVDDIAPTVIFNPDGNLVYAKNRSSVVTVSDSLSGVNTSSLKYLWNTSTTEPSVSSFTSTFTTGSAVPSPVGVTGSYYLWVYAKDIAGNPTIARTSNPFKLDNTPPAITILGSNPANINSAGTYLDAGATAVDAISGTTSVSSSSNVNTGSSGTYTVTYTATDAYGNVGTATRTVYVNALASVKIFLVAGGGGGANTGSGGGAGGIYQNNNVPTGKGVYNVIVGYGNYGGRTAAAWGSSGGDSSFASYAALGGGGGKSHGATGNGNAGGCGGGAAINSTYQYGGTGYQGGNGGDGYVFSGDWVGTNGGGGGAGGNGANGGNWAGAGNGGPGYTSNFSCSNVTYGGGGGGGEVKGSYAGAGGSGGGGTSYVDGTGGDASGIGSGGAGGSYSCYNCYNNGGMGSNGIIYIKYPGPQRASGGTVTTCGSDIIHTFNYAGVGTVQAFTVW